MKFKDKVMLVNLSILGGLVVAYFQGYNIYIIVGTGVVLFVMVSAIFVYRMKKARKQRQ